MSSGRCAWCDEEVDSTRAGTHLKKHIDMVITPGTGAEARSKKAKAKSKAKGKGKKKAAAPEEDEEKPAPPPNRDAFVLKLVCPERPEYWMFLRAHVMSTLSDLDDLLREVWATCCPEHTSRFVVRGDVYSESGDDGDEDDDYMDDDEDDDYMDDDEDDDYLDDPRDMLLNLLGMGRDESRPLGVPLREIIEHKSSFWYSYDSMNIMEISITAYAKASSTGMDSPIGLLARNDPVQYECTSCHAEDASQVCVTCVENNRDHLYCVGCAPEHSCDDRRLVRLENTPRAGTCPLEGLPDKERKARERKAMDNMILPFPFR